MIGLERQMRLFGLVITLGISVLTSCYSLRHQESGQMEKRVDMSKAYELHRKIMARLSEKDFKAIDGDEIFGKSLTPASTFVTKKSRDEVLGIFSEIMEPYVGEQYWADDYGQYHIFIHLKEQPNVWIGVGISLLKTKPETFKDYPDILSDYQTDVIYSHPNIWKPQVK